MSESIPLKVKKENVHYTFHSLKQTFQILLIQTIKIAVSKKKL